MEEKKSPKADLQRSRVLFFEIGAIIALGAVVWAFSIVGRPSVADLSRPAAIVESEWADVHAMAGPSAAAPERRAVTPEILNIVLHPILPTEGLIAADQGTGSGSGEGTSAAGQGGGYEAPVEEENPMRHVNSQVSFMGHTDREQTLAFYTWFYAQLSASEKIAPMDRWLKRSGQKFSVSVRFWIESDGAIRNVKLDYMFIPGGYEGMLENEIRRIILSSAPYWRPVIVAGEPQRTVVTKGAYHFPLALNRPPDKNRDFTVTRTAITDTTRSAKKAASEKLKWFDGQQ